MPDTIRNLSSLQALLADNSSGNITPQNIRDFLVSVYGIVLLEQHTASSSSELDFTNWYSSDYDEYIIEIVNLIPATSAQDLLIQCSTNGGTSYDATNGNYDWSKNIAGSSTNFQAYTNSASDTVIRLANVGNTNPTHIQYRLYCPANTTTYKGFVGSGIFAGGDGNFYYTNSMGRYKGTSAINAFRILMSSGNITSGTVRVYGIRK